MEAATPKGYRTNRAAQVRIEEAKRKLSEQPKAVVPKARPAPNGPEPLSRYAYTRRTVRDKKLEALDSTEDLKWAVGAQEVLKNRGSPTGSAKRVYEQAEELARLQRAVQSKKSLKDKLDRITSEIAALTGNVSQTRSPSLSTSSFDEKE